MAKLKIKEFEEIKNFKQFKLSFLKYY